MWYMLIVELRWESKLRLANIVVEALLELKSPWPFYLPLCSAPPLICRGGFSRGAPTAKTSPSSIALTTKKPMECRWYIAKKEIARRGGEGLL